MVAISIHSLRVEGDDINDIKRLEDQDISIHSLRVEGDAHLPEAYKVEIYFNPLPPCGGRRVFPVDGQ